MGYWTADKMLDKQAPVVVAPVDNDVVTPEPKATQPHKKLPIVTTSHTSDKSRNRPTHSPASITAAPPSTQLKDEIPALPEQGALASIEAKAVIDIPTANKPAVTPNPDTHVAPSPFQKAERLYNQAQLALERQHNRAAVTMLKQALVENPEHMAAREQLAMLLIQDKQPGQAETLLAEGLALSPGRIELAHAYAQLLVERGAFLPALESLQQLADRHSAGAETLALQAGIMTRLQRYADAAETYRQALRLQPRQAVWLTGLGVALEHLGQQTSALDAYQRAIQLPLQVEVQRFVQQRIGVLKRLNAGSKG
jgi:MSHA biogenesis protein MshN